MSCKKKKINYKVFADSDLDFDHCVHSIYIKSQELEDESVDYIWYLVYNAKVPGLTPVSEDFYFEGSTEHITDKSIYVEITISYPLTEDEAHDLFANAVYEFNQLIHEQYDY